MKNIVEFHREDMSSLLSFFLLGCLVGVGLGQVPRPCVSPPQWEARIFSYNEGQSFMVTARLTYDSVYQRVRILEDIQVGRDESFFEVIRLFQGKLEFTIDLKTRNCSRTTLSRPWRDIGIFPDATSFGEAYVGSSASPGDGLLVTIWFVFILFIDNTFSRYHLGMAMRPSRRIEQ